MPIQARSRISSALRLAVGIVALSVWTVSAVAAPFFFSTGDPDGLIATASRPDSAGKIEIESADDFVLASPTTITNATFTGLVPLGSTAIDVIVEIYRVFPKDSTAPPSGNVPTRANSPSDVAFDSRDSAANALTFSMSTLAASFTALNSVQPGGIFPKPSTTTGGDGATTGQEVRFDVTFATPFDLPPDHYFFVPQVDLSTRGMFLWLSSVRPIVPPGTPFLPDLQAWTRDANLDPDWVRIGTDIVGGATPPTFNLAFSLAGETVAAIPEPETWALMLGGLGVLGARRRRC